jgi:hypothetical protein
VPRISWKPGHTGTPTRPKSNGRSKPTKRPEGGGVVASLYTNENFPLPAAEELRRLGHDVLTVQESGLGGQATTDDEVLRFATRQQRVLVTLNRAHFVRLHAVDAGHAGIIACTADRDFLALAARIDGMIRDQGPLEGRLARVHRPSWASAAAAGRSPGCSRPPWSGGLWPPKPAGDASVPALFVGRKIPPYCRFRQLRAGAGRPKIPLTGDGWNSLKRPDLRLSATLR